MSLLILVAFVVGAGTAISPCVLPVLPALLSASGTGGARRPLGIVAGLTVTFTVTIVGLAKAVDGVGLGASTTRWIAIVVLGGFGAALLIPKVADRIEARLSPLQRLGPRTGGDGFWSGTLVGAAFGFVYTPCAGPVLAAVIATSAASGKTVAVGVAYALGSALMLLVLAFGGRAILGRIRRAGRGPQVQFVLGAILLVTAVGMAANLDIDVEQAIAKHIPNASLTAGLEKSHAVTKQLVDLHGESRFARAAAVAHSSTGSGTSGASGVSAATAFPPLGAAPELAGYQQWFNTPGKRPLSLAGLEAQHRTVLIDFWTYTCINCLRTLPYLEAYDKRYRSEGLTIIGVEAPEFGFEKDAGNVADAISTDGIKYPVVQDNNLAIWQSFGNQYWPADYLIDSKGQVRYYHFGEGDDAKTESAIRAVLAEDGARQVGAPAQPKGVLHPTQAATPETYLGTARAAGFVPSEPKSGTHDYAPHPSPLRLSSFSYSGTWTIGPQAAVAGPGALLTAEVQGKDVYIVLSPPASGGKGSVRVTLDGKPIQADAAGSDVHGGVITVDRQRLYHVVSRPDAETHRLGLQFAPGTQGYSFTFG